MIPSIETKIWLAIKERIESIPELPKAYPGTPYTEVASNYLRVGEVSANPTRVMIGDNKPRMRSGFIMLTLVYNMTTNGPIKQIESAGQIAQLFYEGLQMKYMDVCVTVSGTPHVQSGYEDNTYWCIPVRVPWRCFK